MRTEMPSTPHWDLDVCKSTHWYSVAF